MLTRKLLVGLSFITFLNTALATPIEILLNGDFETGDLTGWTQATPVLPPIEWGVTTGAAIGAYSLVSSDNSHFASPWIEGPNPLATTLIQVFDLTTLTDELIGTFTFSAEAIYAEDRISLGYQLFDFDAQPLHSELVFTGAGGTAPNSTPFSQSFSFVSGTRFISFFATAELLSGSYIDAGFDRASILVDVKPKATVPSPNGYSLLVLGFISLLISRRLKSS